MISGFFLKHPDATKSHNIDFAADIPEDDFLGDYVLTVKNQAGDDVLATDEVTVQVDINTTSLTLTISGGIDGENYIITAEVSLDTSTTTPVRVIQMRVRSQDV